MVQFRLSLCSALAGFGTIADIWPVGFQLDLRDVVSIEIVEQVQNPYCRH